MTTPSVSIVIPCRGDSRLLTTTLFPSLLGQSSRDFEVIVSADDDPRVRRYRAGMPLWSELDVRVVDCNFHSGSGPRNAGMAVARGQFLFSVDADCRLEPTAVESLVNALENDPGASFAYSRWGYLDGLPDPTGPLTWDPSRLREGNYIPGICMFRREKFPGYDESLVVLGDWDLFLTVASRGGRGIFVNEVLWRTLGSRSGLSAETPLPVREDCARRVRERGGRRA